VVFYRNSAVLRFWGSFGESLSEQLSQSCFVTLECDSRCGVDRIGVLSQSYSIMTSVTRLKASSGTVIVLWPSGGIPHPPADYGKNPHCLR